MTDLTDRTEQRLQETYGDLKPSLPKERLMAGLPKQFTPKSPLPQLLVAAAALAACVVLLVGFWPAAEQPNPDPTGPTLRFEVTEDAQAVARVMKSRLGDRGIDGAKVQVDAAGTGVAVRLPANTSPVAAYTLLMRPGVLEFRLVLSIEASDAAPELTRWVQDLDSGEPVPVEEPESDQDRFGGEDLDPLDIRAHPGNFGNWVVSFAFRVDRQEDFRDFTSRSVKRQLAIIVDGQVISAPVIQETLPGRGQISGGGMKGFSQEEAEELAAILRSGPLPTGVIPLEPR